ncbi:dnaJ homolog subfamily B member 9-like [Mytilus edulis]|uniref:dnaJ homolog subfamily B member 9-like n=1 Tax=Mytilus edulis TaxID=6550 RepID=UPI0039F04CB5
MNAKYSVGRGISSGLQGTSILYSPFCIGQTRWSSNHRKQKSPSYYYDILGITPKANQQQIKQAYYTMSKKYHPDVSPSPEAHLKFQEISQAYEVLGNSSTRRMYDRGVNRPEYARRKEEHHSDHKGGQFYQQQGFAKRGQRPMTGRTSIYDFDEYYRMHYSDNFKRKQRDIEFENLKQKIHEENEKMHNDFKPIFSFSVVLCIFCSIIYSLNT